MADDRHHCHGAILNSEYLLQCLQQKSMSHVKLAHSASQLGPNLDDFDGIENHMHGV